VASPRRSSRGASGSFEGLSCLGSRTRDPG
jgi:hypothetical protein